MDWLNDLIRGLGNLFSPQKPSWPAPTISPEINQGWLSPSFNLNTPSFSPSRPSFGVEDWGSFGRPSFSDTMDLYRTTPRFSAPSAPYLPFDYDLFRQPDQWGFPSQHRNLQPLRGFPTFRPDYDMEGPSHPGWPLPGIDPGYFGPITRNSQRFPLLAQARQTPQDIFGEDFNLADILEQSPFLQEYDRFHERMRRNNEPEGIYAVPWDYPALSNAGGWVDWRGGNFTFGSEEELEKIRRLLKLLEQ